MKDRTKELEFGKIGNLLLTYALPAIIGTTAVSFYNVIDRIFIGQGVGPLAIAGLAITFPIMNLATAFGTLVGAGASAMVSIRMGEKRKIDATRILGNALIMNIFIGILFSVIFLLFLDDILLLFGASQHTLPYARDFMQIILYGNVITHVFFGMNNIMRASGYPIKAMISVLLTVVCNVIIAPIFIFQFKWGIAGAAWATLISQTIGMIWVLWHFISKSSYIHFQPACFHLRGRIIRDIFAIGLSPFLIHTCACFVAMLINWQLRIYGGDNAIAAFGITNSILSLMVMIILGLTQGMQPIAGFNYGARNMSRVTKVLKLTIYWATGICFVGFIAIMTVPQYIARAFTTDVGLIELTANSMRICAYFLPIIGFQVVSSNFFQSIGKARIAIFLSLSRQIIFLIPFLFILPYFYNLNGVWMSMPAADLFASIITAFILLYFYKKVKVHTVKELK